VIYDGIGISVGLWMVSGQQVSGSAFDRGRIDFRGAE
jgi:hypothetical protein